MGAGRRGKGEAAVRGKGRHKGRVKWRVCAIRSVAAAVVAAQGGGGEQQRQGVSRRADSNAAGRSRRRRRCRRCRPPVHSLFQRCVSNRIAVCCHRHCTCGCLRLAAEICASSLSLSFSLSRRPLVVFLFVLCSFGWFDWSLRFPFEPTATATLAGSATEQRQQPSRSSLASGASQQSTASQRTGRLLLAWPGRPPVSRDAAAPLA